MFHTRDSSSELLKVGSVFDPPRPAVASLNPPHQKGHEPGLRPTAGSIRLTLFLFGVFSPTFNKQDFVNYDFKKM